MSAYFHAGAGNRSGGNLSVMAGDRRELRRGLERLASAQRGYFTATQALEIGYSRQAQTYHVDYDNWVRIDRGLFRLPAWPIREDDHLVQRTVWRGGQAVASHATALSLHDLGDVDPAAVHLSVPQGFRRSAAGLVLHRPVPPTDQIEQREGYQLTIPVGR